MVARGPRSTAQLFETVLADQPEVLEALCAAHDAAWMAVDPDLLDLCRVRVAMLLGHDAEAVSDQLDPALVDALPVWASSPRFSPAQRACIAFTEQFVIDVASIDDAEAAAVSAELGSDGLANFVNALLVIEQRQRLTLAWSRLFPEVVR